MKVHLYHGTTSEAAKSILDTGIKLNASIHPGDFGVGFYLAPHLKQAVFHANKRRRKHRQELSYGVILHYEIDSAILQSMNCLEFRFKSYDWGEMVYQQRVLNNDTTHDVIVGPIADGSIPGIITACKTGSISKSDFIRAAGLGVLGIQYAFKTELAVNALTLVDVIEGG